MISEVDMKWRFCVLICLLSGPLFASVQVRISDPNTLETIDLSEIMVGTGVSLVVHSDANDFWSGAFFIGGQDRAIGSLQAKGGDPNSRDWRGSHLAAAGEGASVIQWKDSAIWGFDLYGDDFERRSGDWFVIDYYALDEGECTVDFYDHAYSWSIPDPNVSLTFFNTPTRDLAPDGFVNISDFAVFSSHWQAEGCSDPNAACYKADLNRDGSVGLEDVMMFADFWLWGNSGWKPAEKTEQTVTADPNTTDPNVVYYVTYAIVDTNSLSEITMDIGESATFYVVKNSIYEDVYFFDMDVIVSDPNLGWVDNSETGSAEILAVPRNSTFDYYGPSSEPNSIQFFAANIGASMLDGDMASFVYTAAEAGTVTLELSNYSLNANLESMTIHQVQPVVEMLQQVYEESPDLQQSISEAEWNIFIENVEASKN